jgi:hypothetical protein
MAQKAVSMVFNVLARRKGDMWIAHCLELDVVTTAESVENLKKDMEDLILAQVDYAFSNDNLDNLYHPAPPEVWKSFYKCKDHTEDRIPIKSSFRSGKKTFVPPWIIAKTCFAQKTSLA